MTYHIPQEVIAKGYAAYLSAPIPGIDAFSSGINAIKRDLERIIREEVEYENALKTSV